MGKTTSEMTLEGWTELGGRWFPLGTVPWHPDGVVGGGSGKAQ